MPSPFPGMDPYLEHPAWWPELHQGLITYLQSTLNRSLPPRYRAAIGERLSILPAGRDIYPDMIVIQRPLPPKQQGETGGGTAVLVASDAPWVVSAASDETRELFIEIRSTKDASEVITLVELLSPANKDAGSEGRRKYQEKQQEILASPTHLVEIDLLHAGAHTVAAPAELLIQRGYWDYLVSLHRGGQGPRFEVWPIGLRQRLPRIHLPLAGDDPDLVLDLQAVFERCYDEGAFARGLDYRQAPPVPLNGADAEWVDGLLKERGPRA